MADLFHNTYHGPRFRYALVYRPLTVCQPQDYIFHSDRFHPSYPHGTIDYPRRLTEKEVADHQLLLIEEIEGTEG